VAGGIENGDFRLGYFRRAKRLLPAACVTFLLIALSVWRRFCPANNSIRREQIAHYIGNNEATDQRVPVNQNSVFVNRLATWHDAPQE
jgi:peptidoglycan/LPS O-acetylase OafA/YrhL